MNPFDWSGPEFLVFYFFLSCLILALLGCQKYYFRWKNSGVIKALTTDVETDPYLIAGLQGRADTLVRVALVALLERGLLQAEGSKLKAVPGAVDYARHPLDKAILGLYRNSGEGKAVFADTIVWSEVRKVREQLLKMGLHDQGKWLRIFSGFVAVGFLWLVALAKIIVALERGHHNIFFLLIMAVVVARVVQKVMTDNIEARVLRGVRERFVQLGARSPFLQWNGMTGEFTFYVAVFGFTNLPLGIASTIQSLDILPPAPPTVGSSSSSSCGSSSCGSSCGGGGGCGGCGGGG
ncbi:MAG: TIGR04222 domain-containing membrane protein [Polyangiaceae bacterium]|nr:TIGR04222 domain-containing membrane protein [Polyangiaceae bacterium]